MADLNLAPIIGSIVNLASSPIRHQLERSEIIIQLRKKLDFNPDHPPSDFTAVYKYALVDYGAEKLKDYKISKPELELVLQIFRQQEIIHAFRKAFNQKNQSILLEEGEDFFDWNILGDRVREMKIDIWKDFTEFQSIFIKVANSTGTPFEVIQNQKIDNLTEILRTIENKLIVSQSHWNNYVNFHGTEELVSFELENSPASLGVAEPDDTGRQEISLGQGFRLVYQLPFSGYALLMQGFKTSWVVTRLSKCEDPTLDKETRYVQERIAKVPVGRWSVPTNKSYLKEKTDIGLHRFALLLAQQRFPKEIQEIIAQETTVFSSSALNTLTEYIQSNVQYIRLIVAECDIIYPLSGHESS